MNQESKILIKNPLQHLEHVRNGPLFLDIHCEGLPYSDTFDVKSSGTTVYTAEPGSFRFKRFEPLPNLVRRSGDTDKKWVEGRNVNLTYGANGFTLKRKGVYKVFIDTPDGSRSIDLHVEGEQPEFFNADGYGLL